MQHMAGPVRADARIGSMVAGYRVEQLIGRGGMGVVYLTHDEHLHRPVALKVVAPELANDPEFRERFLIESRLAASLDHSHVIPIYEAGEAGGELYLAMRYVDGTTLRALLHDEAPLEPARALDLGAQVAEALDEAHSRGLVHRDVKPGNVLIADEGGREHCYLCDFGLSQRAGGPQEPFSGTVAYTAPEQIGGESVDGRADQYALACVLCECLTGSPPFPATSAVATLFAHLNNQPPSLRERRPELPAAIDPVVARGLAKAADERYPSCRDLTAAASKALGLEERTLSRRTLLLAAGGAAAITAAAVIPAILLTRGDGRTTAAQPKPLLPLESDAVLRIDPAGTLIDAVPVTSAAGPITFGDRAVWLADKDRKVVSQIDPAANTIIDEIDVAEGDPGALAVGEGTLWIFAKEWTDPTLRKYDLQTKRWSDVDLGGITSENFVVADGALWSVCHRILRIDLITGHVDADIDPGLQGKLVAAGEGAVWFAANKEVTSAGAGSRVWRIDPSTNALGVPIDLEGTVADIGVGEGAVWLLILEDDLVRRIDLATFEVTEAFRVGRIPEALVAAEGAVWVAASRDGTLTRYDPVSADLKTLEIGGNPRNLAIGGGAVWATVEVL